MVTVTPLENFKPAPRSIEQFYYEGMEGLPPKLRVSGSLSSLHRDNRNRLMNGDIPCGYAVFQLTNKETQEKTAFAFEFESNFLRLAAMISAESGNFKKTNEEIKELFSQYLIEHKDEHGIGNVSVKQLDEAEFSTLINKWNQEYEELCRSLDFKRQEKQKTELDSIGISFE